MEHLKLTIGNIMQSDILFYDKKSEPACFDICEYLKIDNLPAITGKHFFQYSESAFIKKSIKASHRVLISEPLFSLPLLRKFKANHHNVLLAFDDNILLGVVHFSDYNRDIVLQAIQDDILIFERKLRELILLHGFANDDMLKYYRVKLEQKKSPKDRLYYEEKIARFQKNKDELDSLGAFQLFDFSDLLSFASSSYTKVIHEINSYKYRDKMLSGYEVLRQLRNLAMHGKNPVVLNKSTSIYSIDSLEFLAFSLTILRKEFSKLNKKIWQHPDRLRSVELENRSKLEIIHSHHPKALRYFLGV